MFLPENWVLPVIRLANKSTAAAWASPKVWHRSMYVLSGVRIGIKGTEQSNIRHVARVLCLQEAETGKHRKWDDLIKSEEVAVWMGGR